MNPSNQNNISNAEEKRLKELETKKRKILSVLKGQIKRLTKSKTLCVANLKECYAFETKQHEASLLQANFSSLKKGLTQITLPDWLQENKEITIELDPKMAPKDLIAARFKKARKLKIGVPHQEKELLKIEHLLQETIKKIEDLQNFKTLEELLLAYPEKVIKQPTKDKVLPFKEYTSKSGFRILVGKNSKCNDALTFQYAKGSDLWLHVKDYPGSHVVIVRPKKDMEVDKETLEYACQLACKNSKAKNASHAEVCITERKYVSRFGKERSGKVQISKQKIVYVAIST